MKRRLEIMPGMSRAGIRPAWYCSIKKWVAIVALLMTPAVPAMQFVEDVGGQHSDEVEILKRRITELEAQNRQILSMLVEIQGKLGRLSAERNPEKASAAPAERIQKAEPVHWPEIIGSGSRIKLYGSLRLDIDRDSQVPNNAQIPFYITSSGNPASLKSSNFTMHPRLTRLGLDYSGSPAESLNQGKLGGKLEVDFLNGGSESRQIIRIRQAYMKLQWGQMAFLAGQAWDVVSPLFPTASGEAVMWNAGNLGDRRPQARVSFEPRLGQGRWSFSGAVGLTGAVDMLDLDSDGLREGEVSGLPEIQAHIGYARPLWVENQPVSIGISGVRGWQSNTRRIAGHKEFGSQAINADFTVPFSSRLSLRGEGWFGMNLSDVRGGIGQGINISTGREIRGRGGWTELKLRISRYFSLYPGYSIDDPANSDLLQGGRTRNSAIYLSHRLAFSDQFLVGLDYFRWRTDYKGLPAGKDNRFNLFFQYSY